MQPELKIQSHSQSEQYPPAKRFENQVALVTGAAHGMGRVHAARLTGEGASVVLTDVDIDVAQKAAAELPRAIAIRADVTSQPDCDAAVQSPHASRCC